MNNRDFSDSIKLEVIKTNLEKKTFNDLDYNIILNIYNHLIIQNYINKIINYF